jgi:hypothetical protein
LNKALIPSGLFLITISESILTITTDKQGVSRLCCIGKISVAVGSSQLKHLMRVHPLGLRHSR